MVPISAFRTGGRFGELPAAASSATLSEQASGRGLETAEGLFLEAVSDRPNQKGPAETAGGLLTVEVFPALAEVRDTGL